MDIIDCFRDLFKSIPDFRKIVILMFSIKNDNDLSTEYGFLKRDINRLCLQFKTILIEQIEKHLD